MNFAADRVVQTTESFNDSGCNQSAFATIVTSNYKLEDYASPNVVKIDYAVVEVDLLPHTAAVADAWNQSRHCQISDWKEGQAKTVVPDGCIEGIKANSQLFSLVKIDGNNIYLGQTNPANRDEDGLSPDHRFSTINGNSAFIKKGTQVVNSQCPVFNHSYACDGMGDVQFSNYDVSVATNGIVGGTEYVFNLSRPNYANAALHFEVNGQARTANSGSYLDTTQDTCAQGTLVSRTTTTRQSDPNYSRILERHFSIDANDGHLTVSTITQETTDPRNPGPTSTLQNNCRVFQ
jgi:hypothetical protein